MNMRKLFFFFVALTGSLVAVSPVAADIPTTLADQTRLAVTIYNENLALVKDQRHVLLKRGLNALAFRDISARIRPETAILRSLIPDHPIRIREQNFDFDLLTPRALLEHYLGKTIRIARTNPVTGEETIDRARILSTQQGLVVKIGNHIVTNPPGHYIFDAIPDTLKDTPTLTIQLEAAASAPHTLELAYLTGGLSWKADYVALLSPDDSQLELTGWVTLTNQSGTSFPKAQVQLVAGQVNQVHAALSRQRSLKGADKVMLLAEDAAPMMEESMFEYHLYTLGHTTTLANHQTKQVNLLSAHAVPVKKDYLLHGMGMDFTRHIPSYHRKQHAQVYVTFSNDKHAGLGMALPKGIMRVYKKDSRGHSQFIGEDRIAHTPKNDTIRLQLGQAFDITATKQQTTFKKMPVRAPYHSAYESAYAITISNAKSVPVTVTVQEVISGDWEILKESHPHQSVSANTVQWHIQIPAESNAQLNYRVVNKY